MVTENRSSGSRVFPEIRICFFGKAPVLLPRWTSAAVLLAMVAGGAEPAQVVDHLREVGLVSRKLGRGGGAIGFGLAEPGRQGG
ncbi:MAG: hypothetical protein WB710_10335, partial [Stellaceae bacterium]